MAMASATCRIELMGLPDVAAYRRLARGALARGYELWSGLNIPNKKPGEPLLDWAAALREELPKLSLCVHYSLKHQRGPGNPVTNFAWFCREAASLGVSQILLVTGPRGPKVDAVEVLEKLSGSHPAEGIRLGVAFNACLPSETERAAERTRLVRKLRTGLVEDVWLNCGSDAALLSAGIQFIRTTAKELSLSNIAIYGSGLLPNESQLWQMRERPWNGVHFSKEYLESIEGMDRVTREVLATFRRYGVEPIIESKVRSDDDIYKLKELLTFQPCMAKEVHEEAGTSLAVPDQAQSSAPCGYPQRRNRWVRVSSDVEGGSHAQRRWDCATPGRNSWQTDAYKAPVDCM